MRNVFHHSLKAGLCQPHHPPPLPPMLYWIMAFIHLCRDLSLCQADAPCCAPWSIHLGPLYCLMFLREPFVRLFFRPEISMEEQGVLQAQRSVKQ